MRFRSGWLASLLIFGSAPALAQNVGAPSVANGTSALDLEGIKRQLRRELTEDLRESLKAEIKSELAAEGAMTAPVEEDAWAEEEWKWEEPVKPELNFLEFDGYFRFRYDMFTNLDLKTYYKNPNEGLEYGPFAPGYSPPVPICNTDVKNRGFGNPGDPGFQERVTSCANNAGESQTLGTANMRLRLEPVFNVYEDIKIKMQMDVLDNVVLGSTPDGFPQNPISPLLGFSTTQLPPSDGRNALYDSIRVKRVWAEVMTPLGQLRVGRMPSHFGMGALSNAGQGLDSDFGDTNDRLMFATRIGDFYFVPAYDWAVSGPTSQTAFDFYGQPFDRDQRDDVDQYILAIVKRDKDEQIKQKLENDEYVLNFGTYQVGRFQALDSADYYQQGDPSNQAQTLNLIERDIQMWAYSVWVRFLYRKLKIEAEYAGIIGSVGNSALSGPYGATDKALDINQHGAVLNVEYKFLRDALTLQLMVLAASGDSAPGWGIRPLSSVSGTPGSWDGTQAPEGDDTISNFRFDPDMHVDLILWRQLVGMVTDALVIRPSIQYNLTEGLGGRLDVVYSRSWFANSTPSGSFTDLTDSAGASIDNLGSPSANLGLEFDAKLFFDSDDGFHAWLQYGIFIPFSGLDRQVVVEPDSPLYLPVGGAGGAFPVDEQGRPLAALNAGIAHTIQVMLGVTF